MARIVASGVDRGPQGVPCQGKEFSDLRDQLNAERRDLPRERVTENYSFDGAAGERTLEQLFGSCSQLIVYHFMFAPEWRRGLPALLVLGRQLQRHCRHLKRAT